MTAPRRGAGRGALSLTDPAIARRLDALGVPADVAVALSTLDVSITLVERLDAAGLGWDFVRYLLTQTRALQTAEDVAALITLANQPMEPDQIRQWAQTGQMDAALRLYLKNVPLTVVRSLPLPPDQGLRAFLRMLQATTTTGIHPDDLVLWHTAGVLSLTPPHLVAERWVPWRAAAVNHLGMRHAALAAAAGLSVDEAVELSRAGEFNTAALTLIAGLRTGG